MRAVAVVLLSTCSLTLALSLWEREPVTGIIMTAPHTLTIAAAAEQIRTRRLSPVDLVRSCLQRIDQLEPRLQAWVTVDRERAVAAAQRCEEEIHRGQYRGPLHGIPAV